MTLHDSTMFLLAVSFFSLSKNICIIIWKSNSMRKEQQGSTSPQPYQSHLAISSSWYQVFLFTWKDVHTMDWRENRYGKTAIPAPTEKIQMTMDTENPWKSHNRQRHPPAPWVQLCHQGHQNTPANATSPEGQNLRNVWIFVLAKYGIFLPKMGYLYGAQENGNYGSWFNIAEIKRFHSPRSPREWRLEMTARWVEDKAQQFAIFGAPFRAPSWNIATLARCWDSLVDCSRLVDSSLSHAKFGQTCPTSISFLYHAKSCLLTLKIIGDKVFHDGHE